VILLKPALIKADALHGGICQHALCARRSTPVPVSPGPNILVMQGSVAHGCTSQVDVRVPTAVLHEVQCCSRHPLVLDTVGGDAKRSLHTEALQ
jgi:hypothetical protein